MEALTEEFNVFIHFKKRFAFHSMYIALLFRQSFTPGTYWLQRKLTLHICFTPPSSGLYRTECKGVSRVFFRGQVSCMLFRCVLVHTLQRESFCNARLQALHRTDEWICCLPRTRTPTAVAVWLTWFAVWRDGDEPPHHAGGLLHGGGAAHALVVLRAAGHQLAHQDPLQTAVVHALAQPPAAREPGTT